MFNKNIVRIIGVAATVLGIGVTLVTDWVNDKRMDERICEKISEALANGYEKIES